MAKRAFLENIREEANHAITRVFDKVVEIGTISSLRFRINGLKGRISYYKGQIGDIVYRNQERFSEYPEIQAYIGKIKQLEEEIEKKEEEIIRIREKQNGIHSLPDRD